MIMIRVRRLRAKEEHAAAMFVKFVNLQILFNLFCLQAKTHPLNTSMNTSMNTSTHMQTHTGTDRSHEPGEVLRQALVLA